MGLLGWFKSGGSGEKKHAAAAEAAPDPSRRGIELVGKGRYAEAAEAFRKAIASEPSVAAHHVNLAFALQESRDSAGAVGHLKQAAELDNTSFDAHYMLGGALEKLGDLTAAADALRRAVEQQPAMEQAHADLVRVLATDGQTDEACAVADAALARFPTNANLHIARGNLHMAAGESDAALACFDRVLEQQPDDVSVLLNCALALHAGKRLDEALQAYERVLAIRPKASEALAGKARVLRDQNDLTQAIACCREAIDADPQQTEWVNLLGTLLQTSGQIESSIECFRTAIRLRPDLPGGYVNLGLSLAETGDLRGAVLEYDKALGVKPIAEAHDNLGLALQKLGVLDGALHHYREALKLQPEDLNTRCNYAAALGEAGEASAAIDEYRAILARDDRHFYAHSNLLFSLSVYGTASAEEYLEEAKRYGAKVMPSPEKPSVPRTRQPGDALRVGFVSGDLRNHPVGFFLEGVLANLDPRRFHLFAYPTAGQEDDLTARLRPLFSGWRSLKRLTTEEAVAAIRRDEVDMLFDLGGHTGDNRLPVFGARAAPVQVAWLGFFASTGVAAMDYVIADDVCVPEGKEHQFTERVWRLPSTRLCLTPPDPATTPAVNPLPALERGYVTFGCFQRLAKINATVIRAWGRIFQALPTARLFLLGPQTGRQVYVDAILARLAEAGIAASRVTVQPPASRAEYLRAHGEVDIILDTFPFNGGTTTSEALWMGVPTVTMAGDTMISRQGMSMMMAVGLSAWVGDGVDGYVERAIAQALDLESLTRLRASLRETARRSPLFDVASFASRFADAMDAIWAEHTRAGVN